MRGRGRHRLDRRVHTQGAALDKTLYVTLGFNHYRIHK